MNFAELALFRNVWSYEQLLNFNPRIGPFCLLLFIEFFIETFLLGRFSPHILANPLYNGTVTSSISRVA